MEPQTAEDAPVSEQIRIRIELELRDTDNPEGLKCYCCGDQPYWQVQRLHMHIGLPDCKWQECPEYTFCASCAPVAKDALNRT